MVKLLVCPADGDGGDLRPEWVGTVVGRVLPQGVSMHLGSQILKPIPSLRGMLVAAVPRVALASEKPACEGGQP